MIGIDDAFSKLWRQEVEVPSLARGKCLDVDGIAISVMDDIMTLSCHCCFVIPCLHMRIGRSLMGRAHRHFGRWLPLCSLLT